MRKIDEFSKGSLSHEEAKIFALSLSLSFEKSFCDDYVPSIGSVAWVGASPAMHAYN